MAYLTGKEILDQAVSRIQGNSASMRPTFLTWLKGIGIAILNEPRQWQGVTNLQKTTPLPVTDSKITLPADFEEFINVTLGNQYFFDRNSLINDEQAFYALRDTPTGEQTPEWIQLDASARTLLFIPGTDAESATLKYQSSISYIADDETPTAWPDEFLNLFVRALITIYYEFDLHGTIGYSAALDQDELLKLKILDNRRRPCPQFNPHGYTREVDA